MDAEGKVRSFDAFRQDVLKLNDTYNRHYLKAEYQFATQSAIMAGKWADYEDGAGRYNLQYRTAKDDHVRQSHRVLDETTLPLDDPFWDKFYPPNGWRCRCTTVEVLPHKYPLSDPDKARAAGEQATTQLDKNGKNTLAIFRFNPGKEKVLFPPTHPYTKVIGAALALKGIIKAQETGSFEQVKNYENGGNISVHTFVDRSASDYSAVYQSAAHFAATGKAVQILPKLHPDSEAYKTIYKDLIGTPYEGKSPDFRVGKVFYEHEGFISSNPKRAFSNMINRGIAQNNHLIIEDSGVSDNWAIHNLKGRVKNGQLIKEVWVKEKKSLRLLYKNGD